MYHVHRKAIMLQLDGYGNGDRVVELLDLNDSTTWTLIITPLPAHAASADSRFRTA